MAAGTNTLGAVGGAGGAVSTNGDVNGAGAPGGMGIRFTGLIIGGSGQGGSTVFGGGGASKGSAGTGIDGAGYGAGGGGGAVQNGSGAVAGGAGTQGCWVVEEYGV